jgi:hypothetical protein
MIVTTGRPLSKKIIGAYLMLCDGLPERYICFGLSVNLHQNAMMFIFDNSMKAQSCAGILSEHKMVISFNH